MSQVSTKEGSGVHESASVEDLATLFEKFKLNQGSALLHQLQQKPQVSTAVGDTGHDLRSVACKTIERFLEEGRRLKWLDSEVTPEKLLENYDKQRRWFYGLLALAGILGVVIIALEGTLLLHSNAGKSLSTQGTQALYTHTITMTLAVVIGFPLAILFYRLFPNTKHWTVNYLHGGFGVGMSIVFLVGLMDMVIYHEHLGVPHFTSFHSWMGILFTSGLLVELISGMTFFRAKHRKEVVSVGDLRVQIHTFVGECLMVVSLGTWISGLNHVFYDFIKTPWLLNLIGMLTFVLTSITFVLIFHPVFRRRGRPVLECLFNNPNALESQESSKTLVSKEELLSGVKGAIQKFVHEVVGNTYKQLHMFASLFSWSFFGYQEDKDSAAVQNTPRTENEQEDSRNKSDVDLEPDTVEQYRRDRRLFLIGLNILNAVTVVMLSVICYILIRYLEGFSLHPDRAELSDYNVHLICTVMGFVIAPVYAILLFRIFRNVKYSTLTTIHVTFLMPTSFLGLYGIKIAYESHHVYGNLHLFSLHGWLGVGLGAILFFSIISGNWIYLSSTQLSFMIGCHKILGMTSIAIAGSCSISGILTRSQHLIRRLVKTDGGEIPALPSRVIVLNSLGMMIVLFIILSRCLLTDNRFRRRPHPNGLSTGRADLSRYLATLDDCVLLPEISQRLWKELESQEVVHTTVTFNPSSVEPTLNASDESSTK